jgi:plasmid maintenance system antidote protein VapI
MRHIGEAIERRMRELNMSRREVFDLLDGHEGTLSRWINGTTRVTEPLKLARVWAFLGVEDDEWQQGILLLRQEQHFAEAVSREAQRAARKVAKATESLIQARRPGSAGA